MRLDIFARKHVVGIGRGTKIREGRDLGIPCKTVLVVKQVPKDQLDPNDVIPEFDEGLPTDVVEVGEIAIYRGIYPEVKSVPQHRERHRPVVGGISCARKNFLIAGTLGLPLVYLRVGKQRVPCSISNNHVIALSYLEEGVALGEPIRQPSLLDGGGDEDYIGELCAWGEILFGEGHENKYDVAFVRLFEDARPDVLGLGRYSQTGEPDIGMEVKKSGRTTGVTAGRVVVIDAEIRVKYSEKLCAFFKDQFLTTKMMEPGDSGSCFFHGQAVVGLGFAGSDKISVVTPIKNIFEDFHVSLLPAGSPINEVFSGDYREKVYSIWGWDERVQNWTVWKPDMPHPEIEVLEKGKGYFISAKEDFKLTYRERSYTLREGWNLIGWLEEE